jgi:hypothetical protein
MKNVISLFFLIIVIRCQAQDLKNKYLQNESVTYKECISFYKVLETKYPNCKLFEFGKTDVGLPLHLFMITNDKDFDIESIKKKNKAIIFINNGIHAGEPCGVDACLGLSEDLLNKKELNAMLSNVVVCIVPFYNIDGALNRGCCSRANQNGPKEYGFRANAKNLDLNRDFIKCDAQNTKSLIQMIHRIQPHVFIDTHISNGADYSYNMTLITTQHNKLNPTLSSYLNNKMLPALQNEMRLKNNEMCPYVETLKTTPDSGLVGFLETPRFATGYTALFNIIGFVTEAHMLKPYHLQVKATYDLLISMINTTNIQYKEIIEAKKKADEEVSRQIELFPLNWQLDTSKFDLIEFKGYEAAYKKSNVTGLDRLYYNRSKPFTKQIRYYNTYAPFDVINKPKAYLIPQAWTEVIELLQLNKVDMQPISNDTNIAVNCYYFDDYKTVAKPYEGHYLHHSVKLKNQTADVKFYKGDYIVWCNQKANRFILETLEPKATDSYFNWNYFDSALQQKEWFSDYVYEETAEQLLSENPLLKKEFEDYIKEQKINNNHWEQLAWIFKHAPQYEKTAFRYPIFRLDN